MSGNPPTGPASSTPPPGAPGQSDLTHGQRVALWIAGVAVVVAAVATALLALFPNGLSLPEPAQATATTAPQVIYHATRTAQALQMTQPYAPVGVGPCDTGDPPFSRQNANYWQWGSNPGDVTCEPGGVTRIFNDGYVAFYGFPDGFPPSFTAAITLSFASTAMPPNGPSCLTYNLTFAGGEQGLSLCDQGQWQSAQYSSVEGVAQAGLGGAFVIVMQVSPKGVAFRVNNTQVMPTFARGLVTDISLTAPAGLPVGASVAITSFVLTPLA